MAARLPPASAFPRRLVCFGESFERGQQALRYERRVSTHLAFLTSGCALTCWQANKRWRF
jgi:hypothetical protein